MKTRFNAYEKKINDFYEDVIIVCRNCESKAIAKKIVKTIKITCQTCGYNKIENTIYVNYNYWLSINFSGNELWAYNYEHLDFLTNHITAELRERNLTSISNNSIGSRLPKWMTSKKNRENILKALEKLKNK
jgi:hypothetical protein